MMQTNGYSRENTVSETTDIKIEAENTWIWEGLIILISGSFKKSL